MNERKLTKKDLLDMCRSEPPYVIFENSLTDETHHVNPGVPQMLISTLAQFSEKPENELVFSDVKEFYDFVGVNDRTNYTVESRYWKDRPDRIKFFGISQYELLQAFVIQEQI